MEARYQREVELNANKTNDLHPRFPVPDAIVWGKNARGHLIKHRDVIGFDNVSEQAAQKLIPAMKDRLTSLFRKAEPSMTRVGKWHGNDDALFFISDGKMIVTKPNGEFITMIGKTSNKWYELAKPLYSY